MLIDCDTCTVRGEGCADCVVSVLLGAPPGWQEAGPTVVPLTRRPRTGNGAAASGRGRAAGRAAEGDAAGPGRREGEATLGVDTPDSPGRPTGECDVQHVDSAAAISRPVVELDDVERRAVRALAEFGLVPPLRHQDASPSSTERRADGDRHVS